MGGRGSALRWRAILLAMGCTTAWLTGCMVGGTPEEHTGQVESALNELGADTDPPDPGGPPADPEPQPWVPPDTAGTMPAGTPVIHHGDGVKDDDPEPQPWKRDTPGDEQTTSSSSSTKEH